MKTKLRYPNSEALGLGFLCAMLTASPLGVCLGESTNVDPFGSKPQESAVLQPAQTIPASSASDKGVASPAVAPKILTKLVSRGDSLWRISRIIYGDGARYALVYQANRDRIRDPNLIYPGQSLVLPVKRN